MRVTGSCHCGAIGFAAEVTPGSVSLCHCRDCQQLTGSAFRATIAAPPATFELLRGEPAIYVKTADSGSRRRHAFCGVCGTPVFRMPTDNSPNYSLRLGTLDQRAELGAPRLQQWTRSALPWAFLAGDIVSAPGQTDTTQR